MKEEIRSRGSTKQIFKINVDSPLHCPHDLSKTTEFRDDLPTLLNNKNETVFHFDNSIILEQTTSTLFNSSEDSFDEIDRIASTKLKELKFLGPYDRYKLVKPFIEAEEAKAAAERENSSEKGEEGDRSVEDRIADVSLFLNNIYQ